MFVICHIPKGSKIPSYFWKTDSSGIPLITMDLKSANKFNTFKEARTMLESLPTSIFTFTINELIIKLSIT